MNTNKVTGPSVALLFKALERNTCLKTLDLSNNNITAGEHSEAVGQAIEGLLRVNQSLQVLKLFDCRVDDIVIGHIATGLTHNTTLQGLDIGHNRSVTSDGWVQLFQAIQEATTSLQKLHISENNIQSEGVIALSQMLLHKKTITVLGAWKCGLTDDVLKAMATNLSHESSLLSGIYISNNNSLTSEGWIPFCQILQQNSSLRKLIVYDSYEPMDVDQRGNVVTALAEMISRNKGIQELDISKQFIEDEPKLLARSLVQNATLQELRVYSRSSTGRSTIDILEEEIEKLKQEEGIVSPDWNLTITRY